MRISLRSVLSTIDEFRFRHSIKRALALNLRNEVRLDGLVLRSALTRMEIEWYARDIHPWDRDRNISPEDRALMFVQQCLNDTEAAISRLFEGLPQVDMIEVRVLEPRSNMPIIIGTVTRPDVEANENLSVGMRLMLRGLTFYLTDWQFATLNIKSNKNKGDKVDHTSDARAVGHL